VSVIRVYIVSRPINKQNKYITPFRVTSKRYGLFPKTRALLLIPLLELALKEFILDCW